MASASAAAFETSVRAFVGDLRGPTAARMLASAHDELNNKVLQGQQARSGVRPGTRHVVDGKVGAAFESVKPGGRIVTIYDYRKEVALFVLAALRSASPSSSGRYRRSHFMLLNGQEAASLPDTLADSDVVTITNSTPYARRLEVGKKRDGSPFVVQVEPRIYERVAKKVAGPRYRNVAAIAFNYVDLANPYRKVASKRRGAGQSIRYPAIIIKPL
jgi:hypothetical protein